MPEKIKGNLEHIIQHGLDISPDCFGILDDQDRVVFCNTVFASAYGLTKDEVLGRTNKELLRLAWQNQKGIVIDTENFDSWYRAVETLQKSKKLNQFETDFTDGRWFKMTRTNLDTGYILLHGIDITDLKDSQLSLERANQKIEALANTDTLTGIQNRRAFKFVSREETKAAKRFHHPLSVLLMDLDHFKKVNDTYGHESGDFVLREFASVCSNQLRESDSIFRVGGEEFAVLLPKTDVVSASKIAERIRMYTAGHEFYCSDNNQSLNVSVSIGVAQLSDKDHAIKEIMNHADKALYEAKNTGRNKVVVYTGADL